MSAMVDITGRVFGRLTALYPVEKRSKDKKICWKCRCVCGKLVVVSGAPLRRGLTKSCGCLQAENRKKTIHKAINAKRTHGKSHTPIYWRWMSMKARCYYKKNPMYHCYGGRGIAVCKRWHFFENFLKDMGEPPPKHKTEGRYTIERLDSEGDYCPENCIWATFYTQANNTRRNHRITFQNKTKTVAQWARITGISAPNIERRLRVLKWSIQKTLTTPVHTYRT